MLGIRQLAPLALLGCQGWADAADPIDTPAGTVVDGDGDGAVAADDCDDADPAVSPGANDICQDSVDQDCDGVDRACEDRRLEDADAMLFAEEGWGVASGYVAVVGSHVVGMGGWDEGAVLRCSSAMHSRGAGAFSRLGWQDRTDSPASPR